MKSLVTPAVLVVALVALALPGQAPATEASPQPQVEARNIHFSLEMIDTDAQGGTTRKVVETLAVAESQTQTHAGWKMAIPVTTTRTALASESPAVSYTYQDVGLSLSVQGSIGTAGRVRAAGRVEISGVDRPEAQGVAAAPMPQIGTFNHRFEATLSDGQATQLVAVPKPDGGLVKLLLTASIRP